MAYILLSTYLVFARSFHFLQFSRCKLNGPKTYLSQHTNAYMQNSISLNKSPKKKPFSLCNYCTSNLQPKAHKSYPLHHAFQYDKQHTSWNTQNQRQKVSGVLRNSATNCCFASAVRDAQIPSAQTRLVTMTITCCSHTWPFPKDLAHTEKRNSIRGTLRGKASVNWTAHI